MLDSTKNRLGAAFVTAAGVSLVALPAWAAGGGGYGFPWGHWAVSVGNLIIFLFIVVKFGGPSIQAYFKARRETLLSDLDEAKRLREEAEARLEEYSARLDGLEAEEKRLLDEYHVQGQREKERIVAEAKAEVERMRRDAAVTIEQETKKAVAELEKQAVTLAVDMAEELARERLDRAMRKQLVDGYVAELEGLEVDAGPRGIN